MTTVLTKEVSAALRGAIASDAFTAASSSTVPATVHPTIDAALIAYSHREVMRLTLVLLASYALMSVLCGGLVVYLRYNRHVALKGNSGAARKVLLPSFEPLLWLLLVATGGFALFLLGSQLADYHIAEIYSVHTESVNAGRAFVVMFVAVFMLQKSVSLPALARSAVLCLALSCYSIPIVYLTASKKDEANYVRSYWVIAIAHGALVLLYAFIAVRPPGRANKQTLREYCAFGAVYHVLDFAYLTAFYHWRIRLGFMLAYTHVIWGSLCPLVVWRVLLADTEHWRGMGKRACELQSLFCRANMHEHVSAQGLHVLIELHRRSIIDFAYLELHERIGVGSTATVYRGVLRSRDQVAVKVYTPASVTEDIVATFSHEAALCGALNHPNIVTFHGMCVSPPTICLVSELCIGSLGVVTRAGAVAVHAIGATPRRQQLLINLGYMIDAARAVAYLHSFSPAFVHRDIKPGNFLVDGKGNVKLTDFGDSRSLPRANIAWEVKVNGSDFSPHNIGESRQPASTPEGGLTPSPCTSESQTTVSTVSAPRRMVPDLIEMLNDMTDEQDVRSSISYVAHELLLPSSSHVATMQNNRVKRDMMTVTGTVDYMAPEIINGKSGLASYGEAVDVYALGITMWDVLYPGVEKYPSTNNNYLRIFDSVVSGARPTLDDTKLHPRLRTLLESSWEEDPRRRPTAPMMVRILEQVQEEVCVTFALELRDEMELGAAVSDSDAMLITSFSGALAVHSMQAIGTTASAAESVRLGNMLMNAGILHHVKHARSFDDSDDSFFFDADLLGYSTKTEPVIAILEQLGSSTGLHQPSSAVEAATSVDTSRLSLGDLAARHTSQREVPLLSPHQWQRRSRLVPFVSKKRSRHDDMAVRNSSENTHQDLTNSGSNSSISTTSTSMRGNRDGCACRQLGQLHRGHRRRRHGRNHGRHRLRHKYKPIPEESITAALTANLLAEESGALDPDYEDAEHDDEHSLLDGYEAYGSPIAADRATSSSTS
jgi:serine/threonine protein kinase